MDTDLIEAFISIVEHKSFTRAAEALFISQSALSYRLEHLEKELGMQFIIRSRGKREFELTQAGAEFLPLAERWMALARDTVHFKKDVRQRVLSVSCIETISTLFAGMYREIIFQHPFLLSLHVYSSPQTILDVEAQLVDVGFIVRERISRNIKITPIFSERHYLVGCLHSDKKMIDPRTLDQGKELLTDWSSTFRTWHDTYFDISHRPLAEVDTASSVFNYFDDGIWCIVPACAVPFLQSNAKACGHPIQVYDIPNPPPDRICFKVTNRAPRANRLENIRYFENCLDKFLKEQDLHL